MHSTPIASQPVPVSAVVDQLIRHLAEGDEPLDRWVAAVEIIADVLFLDDPAGRTAWLHALQSEALRVEHSEIGASVCAAHVCLTARARDLMEIGGAV